MELTNTVVPEFLTGGGEMGALIRSHDWASTPLGSFEKWPQSLKTCVRIILTSSQPMFVWWGPELINLYNDPYRSILGGKHPNVLGMPAAEVWKEIWDDVGPRATTCMEKNIGTYDEAMLLIMERNGYPEETYYTFSYSPIPGDSGGTNGIICANTDDTLRITGERQLRTLRDLGRTNTENTSDAAVFEHTIHVLKENPHDFPFACIYQLGTESNTAIQVGSTLENVLPARLNLDTAAADYWKFQEAISFNKTLVISSVIEGFGNLPSGAWARSPDNALVIPVNAAQSKVSALLIVGLNPHRQLDDKYSSFFQLIADQLGSSLANVYAYEEARRRAEALIEIDRAKTAFFNNISHEFRTPLTLMLGPLEELLAGDTSAFSTKQRADLEITQRNANRLLKLVNTLLDFSRIEAKKAHAQYFPVDLANVTTDLAGSFRSAIEHAGMELEVDCRPLQETAYVDRDMWEKIVLNLLSNAFKYTLKGTISVSLREEDNKAVLRVKDTGIGIPAEELPHMFERFHRVKQSGGRSFEGTGIGLSLVKELVLLHEGTITVESEAGKGSTFTVSIPLGADHLPAAQVSMYDNSDYFSLLPESFAQEAAHQIEIEPVYNGEIADSDKPLILVVDDNADMRDYLQRLLQHYYVVDIAANGKLALERIRQQVPELVISDVMMPEMDGVALLNHLKNDPQTSAIPIILLSARAGEEAKIAGYDVGADDYLVKPFSAKELLARVRVQIRITRLHRHAVEILQQSAQELEQKVDERTAELLRKNNELEQFAYIASHDLQEPLRKIRTFSELLQKSMQGTGTQANHYFEKIQSSAARMTALIKDVLEYSRLSNPDARFVDTDLQAILKNTLTDFELLIEQKGALVQSDALPVVRGIPLQLQQLFTNLIGNSLKFCDKKPVIKITGCTVPEEEIPEELSKDQAYIKLIFQDNGIGFEQQFSDRIFTIFQRLNEKKAYAGTGIGLALCKKIAENHHGLIRADAELGKGASFTVYLPK
ncbi:ATP-binding protein [Chitinophaga silvisoli]|uniref:histidine kinase n=1 Tax=Chitinophaga silvisoli TaxID=2291814 RepID=A0A3E1NZA9_9BACT|nr:ATP-binding protein [Chitinophaga silvisoli]RFM33281.1 response regulator [Chitinophaga silvisoli]